MLLERRIGLEFVALSHKAPSKPSPPRLQILLPRLLLLLRCMFLLLQCYSIRRIKAQLPVGQHQQEANRVDVEVHLAS